MGVVTSISRRVTAPPRKEHRYDATNLPSSTVRRSSPSCGDTVLTGERLTNFRKADRHVVFSEGIDFGLICSRVDRIELAWGDIHLPTIASEQCHSRSCDWRSLDEQRYVAHFWRSPNSLDSIDHEDRKEFDTQLDWYFCAKRSDQW